MSDESAAKVRNMLSKSAFQSIIDGFWQTRVANGLTKPADAETHVEEQRALLDSWYPDP